jgi:hypothetical protein
MNEKQRTERVPPAPTGGCPVCGGGPLVPLRGLVRCARCQWAMCAGCEPAPEVAEEEEAVTLK